MHTPTPFRPTPLSRVLILAGIVVASPVWSDATPQTLPFSQDWTNTGLVSTSDDWSGVPGIVGYRGDGLTSTTSVNAGTVLADGLSTPIDVNANQSVPNSFNTGGVTEFHLADPVVALTGSGTADAPFLLIHLDTRGFASVQVQYLLRDLDGSTDNAEQQVALQYRIGNSGNFINVPEAYVADATTGPSEATKTTAVNVTLPAEAGNQPLLQLRILTTNAASNDEWVGIDNIVVSGTPGGPVDQPIVTDCPSLSLAQGQSASIELTASDADGLVDSAAITSAGVPGIALGTLVPATEIGGQARVPLTVDGSQVSGQHTVLVEFGNSDGATSTCNLSVSVIPVTPIAAIQGQGAVSPLVGQTVTTDGVVTLVIPNYGWFMQDPVGDGDDATSEGLFVYRTNTAGIAPSQRLRLRGQVAEFNGLTELTGISDLVPLGTAALPAPVTVTFPEATEGDLERQENMLIRIDTELTVAQNYFQGRYGEVTLAAGGRLEKPSNRFRPNSPEALALADDNARRRITLDDASNLQNPNPIPYIGADDTLRAGDTVAGLTGVLYHGAVSDSLRDFKLHPTVAPTFQRAHARTDQPAPVDGNVKVASFNVLNYFTTLDQSGAQCFPSLTRSDCRGADSALEFARQRDKIVAALRALDADVVGLMEIENNGNVALENLVDGLNAVAGAGTYAPAALPAGGTGGDAIRVAMLYKPSVVSPVGPARSDTDPIHHRPPLAQTFAAANGERFSVVVNHFKSKGSCPADPADANADQGDGQGCWNALRLQQAQALRAFVADLQGTSGDDDVLVIGDLNAYGKEDPVVDFTDHGYVDLIARDNAFGYSYVFDGEAGYLDQALASPSLAAQATRAVDWHINADEPSVIDYNTEYKSQDLYTPTPFRASDHDPVLVGLNLLRTVAGSNGRDTLVGTAGDDVLTGGKSADTLSGLDGRDRFVYTSVLDGVDVISDFQVGLDQLDLAALLRSLGIGASGVLQGGYVTCTPSGTTAVVGIDADGSAPKARSRALVQLRNVSCASLMTASHFRF
ncbi:MAG: ExeM/NucH family extracellular endonuclease [Pseudomonadota bacterium]